ncbi:hypothetical protein AGR6A_pb0072 [Agrobacterium sp. NCPPB 925]|nr:hypothetical protein AGR6A_pb0072 [Agrobacterium sp. NCPPB 925]
MSTSSSVVSTKPFELLYLIRSRVVSGMYSRFLLRSIAGTMTKLYQFGTIHFKTIRGSNPYQFGGRYDNGRMFEK